MIKKASRKYIVVSLSAALAVFFGSIDNAQSQMRVGKRSALVITNDPMPTTNPNPLYSRPSQAPDVTPDQLTGPSYFGPANTIVSQKISDLEADLFGLQSRLTDLSNRLAQLEQLGELQSAEYYASTATINTQLQSGTTPGNPRLIQRLTVAQQNLDQLAQNVADLNTLAVEIANAASMSSFLLETSRSTYSLSGAVEEDHARLSQLEDQINNTTVLIDRLLNQVNDDISRTVAYLSSERNNLRTLSLAVTNGDLYGKSLANRPFTSVPQSGLVNQSTIDSPRQLVKIRFDRPNVDYQQPVYLAVNEAMERYPSARIELVAVHPTQGNAAQVAIESTRARRNAERVLRTLTQMGLPLEKIDLSYTPSPDAKSNEVHIFLH